MVAAWPSPQRGAREDADRDGGECECEQHDDLERGSRLAPFARPAIVNGTAGVVVAPEGGPFAVVGFTVAGGRIVEIDLVADPEKLRRLA